MKDYAGFIGKFILWSIGLFLLWYFFLQYPYQRIVAAAVAFVSPIMSYGKISLLSSSAEGVLFRVFSARADFLIDEGGLLANIVLLVASLLAVHLRTLLRLKWFVIGIVVFFFFHIAANSIIIGMFAEDGKGAWEAAKIFTDGVLLMGLPVIFWAALIALEKKVSVKTLI